MRTHVLGGTEARDSGATPVPPSQDVRSARQKNSLCRRRLRKRDVAICARTIFLNRSSPKGASDVSQTVLTEQAVGSGNSLGAWGVQRCARRRQQHESVYRRLL